MTPDFAEVERWVRAELSAGRQTGVVDVTEVAAHPRRELVACTLHVRDDLDADPVTRVAVVDVDTARCDVLELGPVDARSARWSPDGERLAVLVSSAEQTPSAFVVEPGADGSRPVRVAHRMPDVGGAVEDVFWSPDGARLGLVVAEFGAEVSDVHGSGTVAGPTAGEGWRPLVSPAPDRGRRTLRVWTPASDTVEPIRADLNVWEAAWMGPDRFVVVASEGAGEGAWYDAGLHVVGTDGRATTLHDTDVQLAAPSGSPSGERWGVVVGRASDRGLLAGDLVVGRADAPGRRLDTVEVDVTAHQWLDDRRIGFAGTRAMATVFGVVDVVDDSAEVLLDTDGASGLHQPECGATTAAGRLVAVLERHDRPPALTVVDASGPGTGGGAVTTDLLSTAGPGTDHVQARAGRTTPCSWTSKDGTRIDGLLTVPGGDGPHPLVVNVHGGPVATWRDGWIGKDAYAAVLAARGFAVLRPNPRGSAGRGQEFIEAVVADMGGADVDDILTGVTAMIDRGVTEAGRVGITGNSYGGFMAAWIPCWSDAFAAAVSRSPVVDWRTQHLTGNLAEFDQLFVGGDPFDPQSSYVTRSPLTYHHQVRTPMLLTAGAHDLATPASQAVQMHRALLRTGVPTQLAVYPEEGHGVRRPDALADQLARMVWWFERYLDPGPRDGGQP